VAVITVPFVAVFVSGSYTGRREGCYVDGLFELCHKCVTGIQKMLKKYGVEMWTGFV